MEGLRDKDLAASGVDCRWTPCGNGTDPDGELVDQELVVLTGMVCPQWLAGSIQKTRVFSRTTTSWDLGTAILHSLPSCLRTCHFTRVMQVDNLTPWGCNQPRSPGLVLDPFWEGGGIILATTKISRPHPTWRLKPETWLVTHRRCAPAVRPSAPVCGTYPGSWLLEFRQLSFRSCRWRRNRCSSMRSRFLSRFSIGVRALACGYCEGTNVQSSLDPRGPRNCRVLCRRCRPEVFLSGAAVLLQALHCCDCCDCCVPAERQAVQHFLAGMYW